MSLHWDESLELGFADIDDEHRSIFTHFENLATAAQEGQSTKVIAQLVDFLFEYTHVHFAHEDKIMQEYKYPKIDIQRKEHIEFTQDTNQVKARIEKEGASRELAIEVTGKLLRWLINHIKKHDRELVEYIKEFNVLQKRYSEG
jgi:hemerythrin